MTHRNLCFMFFCCWHNGPKAGPGLRFVGLSQSVVKWNKKKPLAIKTQEFGASWIPEIEWLLIAAGRINIYIYIL